MNRLYDPVYYAYTPFAQELSTEADGNLRRIFADEIAKGRNPRQISQFLVSVLTNPVFRDSVSDPQGRALAEEVCTLTGFLATKAITAGCSIDDIVHLMVGLIILIESEEVLRHATRVRKAQRGESA